VVVPAIKSDGLSEPEMGVSGEIGSAHTVNCKPPQSHHLGLG
jgi:hypothetical protein